MVKPTIYLALTDDWELRGNGSGDMERLQFEPMRKLTGLFQKYGVRSTFNAELMQQLTMRKLQDQYPQLKLLADAWDEHVREAFRQGHDIQLHLHPQWSGARYEEGKWRLPSDWSLLKHPPETVNEMLVAGRDYLEKLLRPLDAAYMCVSFRAGSSCIAPSPFMLGLLAGLGLIFDMSIVGGLRVSTRNIQMDYTNCEESFLPFYPRMEDARRVSTQSEPIACVPIHHFYGSRRRVVSHLAAIAWRRAKQKLEGAKERDESDATESYAQQEWADTRHTSPWMRLYEKAVRPCLEGKHLTSDIGKLSYPFMREMLASIRRQARASGLEHVPVILTNHSKYIEDYEPIDRFLRDATATDDIKFLTLTELAGKLQSGEFPIKTAASQGL